MVIEDLRHRPWLLLPGTLCTSAVFAGFLDTLGVLPERRQTINLGRPTVEDYKDIFTSMSPGAVICGFSLGALVAAHCVHRFDAAQVILFGVNPFADTADKTQGRHDLARDVKLLGGSGALAKRLPRLNGSNTNEARATILAMADATAADIDAQTSLALTRPGALDALSRTQSPVMVLTGTDDQQTTVSQGKAAAKAAPKGQFCTLPNLGHYALLENPVICAEAVVNMMARADADTSKAVI